MTKSAITTPLFRENRFIAASRGNKHGDSIRVKKALNVGYYKRPKDIYLVYMGIDVNKQLAVRHFYRAGIDPDKIAEIEEELVKYAKYPNEPRPYQIAKDFTRIDFPRPAYFTAIVDGAQWGFYYPSPEQVEPVKDEVHDPIVFIERKTLSSPKRAKNFAFYNAEPVTPDNCNGVRCINFFTDQSGKLLTAPTDYCFEIYIRVPFSEARATGRHITVIIDPDGQNQGPPVRDLGRARDRSAKGEARSTRSNGA
jgi:hypothetical protein